MATQKDFSRPESFHVAALLFILILGIFSTSPAEVTLDGSLGRRGPVGSGIYNGSPTTYLITDDLGRRAGNNLFHSFGKFNIYSGESATFTGPEGIENIIGRVTGGSPSTIDGRLTCTIEGANLFLLNPSGVMFKPNAVLDVKGSFHVSTADYIRFSNDDIFYSSPIRSSVLSVAAPEAFGFLSPSPGDISVDRSILHVPDGKSFSIIGGNIDLTNDPSRPDYNLDSPAYYTLTACGGRINLVSIASPGTVNMNASDLGISSFAKLGTVTLHDGANINVSSSDFLTPAGSVVVRGGKIVFRNSGIDAYGSPGGVVDIKGESLALDSSYFAVFNFGDENHPGYACSIDLSGDFIMKNESNIDSSTSDGPARGGDIHIVAAGVTLGDDAPGTGAGKDTGYYGFIRSVSYSSGRSGDISISTGDLTVKNGFYINTAAEDTGDAGNIALHADTMKFLDQGNVSSNAVSSDPSKPGKGGIVYVHAREILISAANEAAVVNSNQITGIASQTRFYSDGGRIEVTADNLQLLDGGQISTVLWGKGRGADVDIAAKNILISGFVLDENLSPVPYGLSAIDARLFGSGATGTGGNINITTDHLKLTDYGVIRTGLYADENGGPPKSATAGDITISAWNIEISNRGQIYADSFRGEGNSGSIDISADTMRITGAGSSAPGDPALSDIHLTGLSTTTNAGKGGTINLSIAGDLSLENRAEIRAETQGSGLGGTVSILATNIFLAENSSISAASSGQGNAGDINVRAKDTFFSRNGFVTTEASESDGGNIQLRAARMIRIVDGEVSTSVGGGPETVGGNISSDSDFIVLQGSGVIANAYEGKGGNIKIRSGVFLADPASIVDASSRLGIDGTVDIRSPITNISGLITPLPKDFASAVELLRDPCEVRASGGKSSSFVLRGRDGVPNEPGGILPSP